jgi:hypothetical protein
MALASPASPKMLVRSIGIDSWAHGLEMFDGQNPLKVAKHMANPSMIWLFTIELMNGQITFVTRLNDIVVRCEFPTSDKN